MGVREQIGGAIIGIVAVIVLAVYINLGWWPFNDCDRYYITERWVPPTYERHTIREADFRHYFREGHEQQWETTDEGRWEVTGTSCIP